MLFRRFMGEWVLGSLAVHFEGCVLSLLTIVVWTGRGMDLHDVRDGRVGGEETGLDWGSLYEEKEKLAAKLRWTLYKNLGIC